MKKMKKNIYIYNGKKPNKGCVFTVTSYTSLTLKFSENAEV